MNCAFRVYIIVEVQVRVRQASLQYQDQIINGGNFEKTIVTQAS